MVQKETSFIKHGFGEMNSASGFKYLGEWKNIKFVLYMMNLKTPTAASITTESILSITGVGLKKLWLR